MLDDMPLEFTVQPAKPQVIHTYSTINILNTV